MRSLRDYVFLARDFWRFVRGKDYFRQSQGLGSYFVDERCYYNDLRGKAVWRGAHLSNVPALYIPSQDRNVISPCMVMLYGLGNLDRFFLETNPTFLANSRNVAAWLVDNVRPEGYWDGGFMALDTAHRYYSNNSSMNQGLALSFLVRILEYRLIEGDLADRAHMLVKAVVSNMLLPIAAQGTALRAGDDLFFCEFARTDDCVVLNGWIYGVFGLWDYCRFYEDSAAEAALEATLRTLQKFLPSYRLPDDWSLYDNRGRVASPFYHDLHISLLDALHRLTGDSVFAAHLAAFERANSRRNRVRYMMGKIREKLTDTEAYGSEG